MKNYFITGLSGFLGNNILKILYDKDVRIFGLLMSNDPYVKTLSENDKVTVVTGNILNKDDVLNFYNQKCDGDKFLIHCAGRVSTLKNHDNLTMKINFDGTKNIVDLAKDFNFKKIVYISSVDALDRRDLSVGKIVEQEKYNPKNVDGVYSKSKALATEYVLSNCSNSIAIMPSAILGPFDTFNSPINKAINQVINNKLPAIVKGGYNLVDVRDVAQGVLNACESEFSNTSYIFAGHNISIKDLIDFVASYAGAKKVKKVVPHFLIELINPFILLNFKIHKKMPLFTSFSMDCLKQNSNYSSEKAMREINYKSRSLETTIIDTINWLKERNKTNNK